MSLKVSEVFESIQGEGPNIGRPSTFLRLARCNQACVFCDTPYTWRFDERLPHRSDKVYNAEDEINDLDKYSVYSIVNMYSPSHLVITGGEPLLQQQDVAVLMDILETDSSRRWTFEFETAGTIKPLDSISKLVNVSYVVSPKLANSGNELRIRRRPEALARFSEIGASFKFVVCTPSDFAEIDEIVTSFGVSPRKVYIMGEGTDAETLSRHTLELIPGAIDRGYNVTTRLQIYAFGNRRGV